MTTATNAYAGLRIILASQSPRRKTLLESAEIPFEVRIASTDESFPPDMPVEEVPVHIAMNKALAIVRTAGEIVIAADTIVVLENNIIGKPSGRDDAIRILSSLSGKVHRVITGVVIANGERFLSFADTTEVEFTALTSDQIVYYVDKFQPYDKAGAYAIQEWIGVTAIKRISGDFYNVMGLPVSRVVKTLQQIM